MSDFVKTIVKIKHDGREVFGVSYMPQNVKKCPVVIASHGFNGTSDGFSKHGEYLASNGIASYSFDFCGGSVHTKSDLTTSEMSVFTEVEDLRAVIECVKSWEQIDTENIFLFGESQGGMVTAITAEEYTELIKGVVLLYPAFCIPDDWNKRFPTRESIPDAFELWGVPLSRVYFEAVHGYDVFQNIGKYNKNVLILHGDQDSVVSVDYGIRASKHYPNAQIQVFQGEGHGFSEEGSKRVMELTLEFIKSN